MTIANTEVNFIVIKRLSASSTFFFQFYRRPILQPIDRPVHRPIRPNQYLSIRGIFGPVYTVPSQVCEKYKIVKNRNVEKHVETDLELNLFFPSLFMFTALLNSRSAFAPTVGLLAASFLWALPVATAA